MILRRSGVLCLALGLPACPVDERRLVPAPTEVSTAGSASAAGGSEGEGGSSGDAAGSSGEGLVDGCADLDTDGVGDCGTTIVENPTFAEDVDGWKAAGGATLRCARKNALADLPSGSAEVTVQTPELGFRRVMAAQCVRLDGEWLVVAYASAFVEPTEDAGDPVRAQLEVNFFEGEDCAGRSDGFFETPASSRMGEWTTIQAGGVSRSSTRSLSIALVGVKAASGSELAVYFDNVMLKANALKP
jgi:hypothetical protein